LLCCFFFSSRRRHTRFSRDWSSDVCSSDLAAPRAGTMVGGRAGPPDPAAERGGAPRAPSVRGLVDGDRDPRRRSAGRAGVPLARSEERRVGKGGGRGGRGISIIKAGAATAS